MLMYLREVEVDTPKILKKQVLIKNHATAIDHMM